MPKNTDSDRVTLYYRQGGSDKVYQAAVEPSGKGFVVNFAYGRRGSTLQSGTKTPAPLEYAAARKLFDKLVREKTAKGFTPGEDGTPYRHSDHAQRFTGILPQLLNPIGEEDLELYINDERWWMQEKFDGRRLLVRKHNQEVLAINPKGLSVGLPEPIACAVLTLAAESCLLDGEAVGEVYHAFDLLEQDRSDLRSDPYALRYDQLVQLIDPAGGIVLRFAQTATDAGEKACMLLKLRERRREGVVFKDRGAGYTPGRPTSGGPQVKLKFYATCSCLVAAINRGRRSVALELIDGKKHVAVGNVTIPPDHAIPTSGQVAEVRYLYVYPGGSLFQPLYLGPREDIPQEACAVTQLKYRGEAEDDG